MSIINVIRPMRDLVLRKILFRRYSIAKGFHAGLRVRIWGRQKVVIGEDLQTHLKPVQSKYYGKL